jgi:hypothetical protein
VAKAALRDKHLLSTLHGGLIEPFASPLDCDQIVRRVVRRRLFGSDQRRHPYKEGNGDDYFRSFHSLSPQFCVIRRRFGLSGVRIINQSGQKMKSKKEKYGMALQFSASFLIFFM